MKFVDRMSLYGSCAFCWKIWQPADSEKKSFRSGAAAKVENKRRRNRVVKRMGVWGTSQVTLDGWRVIRPWPPAYYITIARLVKLKWLTDDQWSTTASIIWVITCTFHGFNLGALFIFNRIYYLNTMQKHSLAFFQIWVCELYLILFYKLKLWNAEIWWQ